MAHAGTSTLSSGAAAATERRRADEATRFQARRLVGHSDVLLDRLERLNLMEVPIVDPVSLRQLDDLLRSLITDRRPSRPERPTPTRAIEIVFSAQALLFRQLHVGTAKTGVTRRRRRPTLPQAELAIA